MRIVLLRYSLSQEQNDNLPTKHAASLPTESFPHSPWLDEYSNIFRKLKCFSGSVSMEVTHLSKHKVL